jgi:hypothetical protein
MGMLIRVISDYSTHIFKNIGINKEKDRGNLPLRRIRPKSMEDYTILILNTYSHFSLSSKSWDLRWLRCNVPGHEHVIQLRDSIKDQLKDERMVLCGIIFEQKKINMLANINSNKKKKPNKYLLIGVLPVFDALVGSKACLEICLLILFFFILKVGRDF